MINISIVIPAYNEEAAIKLTLDKLKKVIQDHSGLSFEIIVVNDFSQDQTLEILKQLSGITLINNPYNLGYGASLKRGIKVAKGEWIFIADADGTYPIDCLADFFPYMSDYDMVVGARTNNQNSIPFFRRPAKTFLNWFASWLVNFKIPDLNSGMRIFKRDLCLEFWGLYPKRFSFTSTITMAFIKNNYLVKYVPINYYKRVGKSSIVPWNFFTFLSLIFRLAFYFQPLKFLLPVSIFILLTGIIKGAYDLWTLNFVGNFSVGLILIAILFIFTASTADLLFKQRK